MTSLELYVQKETTLRNNIADVLADNIIDTFNLFNELNIFEFATDFDKCETEDIIEFLRLNESYGIDIQNEFSIKDYNTKHLKNDIDVFAQYLDNEHIDLLEKNNLLDDYTDLSAIYRIINKHQYGGGDYELWQRIKQHVFESIVRKIKNELFN